MYTQKLINEVKELYPDYPKMHQMAEEGSVWLGAYLEGNGCIGLDAILTATSLHDLQETARFEKRKIQLYKDWTEQDPRKR